MGNFALPIVAATLALVACGPDPLVELRRVVLAGDPGSLHPAQRRALGCDPCVLLPLDEAAGRSLAVVGPAEADLVLAREDFASAELRERPSLTGGRRIYDLLLVTKPSAHSRLEALRARHPRARLAVSLSGGVVGLTPTATWPERMWLGRFRDRARAEAFQSRFGLPLAFLPMGDAASPESPP